MLLRSFKAKDMMEKFYRESMGGKQIVKRPNPSEDFVDALRQKYKAKKKKDHDRHQARKKLSPPSR